MKNPISIHPGVKNGRRVHPLVNTSKPTKGKGKLAKKRKKLNERRVAREATVKTTKLKRGDPNLAFKVPGSLNQHK